MAGVPRRGEFHQGPAETAVAYYQGQRAGPGLPHYKVTRGPAP